VVAILGRLTAIGCSEDTCGDCALFWLLPVLLQSAQLHILPVRLTDSSRSAAATVIFFLADSTDGFHTFDFSLSFLAEDFAFYSNLQLAARARGRS
jgi:hypothetical protein